MILLDTHVVLWAFQNDPRLGKTAAGHFVANRATPSLLISAITPWEIALLVEKGRYVLPQDVRVWIDSVLTAPGVRLAPLEPSIAIDSAQLPGALHGDPADRFLIATARHYGCALLTADRAILDYGQLGHVAVVDASR